MRKIITANSKITYPEALLSARKGMAEGGGVTISWPDKPADCRIIESGLEQAEIILDMHHSTDMKAVVQDLQGIASVLVDVSRLRDMLLFLNIKVDWCIEMLDSSFGLESVRVGGSEAHFLS